MSSAIVAQHLTKRFPEQRRLRELALLRPPAQGPLAVDDVSFSVSRGEIFGLVGPNGAGKTTLVKLLATLVLPTSGTAWIEGHPLEDENAIKATLGLMTCNERSFYPRLSCRENLRFYAGLHDLAPQQTETRIAELTPLLDLDGFLDKRYDTCSTGMKHRLALARALLNHPTLLFLDEPTASLDPLAALRFRETLYGLAHRERRTIFLVTHDLDEAVSLCDRVGVMLEGRLRLSGSPEALRRFIRSQESCRLTLRGFTPQIADRLRALEGVLELDEQAPCDLDESRIDLRLRERKRDLLRVIQTIEEAGGSVQEFAFRSVSWDALFAGLPEEVQGEPESVPHPAPRQLPDEGNETRQLYGSQTLQKALLFLKRDLRMQMRYRLSFVLQFLGMVFSVASFYFMAQVFGPQASPYLSAYGGDYFPFVLIGIAFAGYQSVALYSFAGTIQAAQSMGTLEAMLATPTRLPTILFASSLWNFAFTSLRVILYLLIGMLLFGVRLEGANVPAGLAVLLLTITSLSGIGVLSGSFIMAFKRGNPLNFLIGGASTLLGGVYYPIAVLPAWLQPLAYVYPLTYSLRAMRGALLTGESWGALLPQMGALLAFSAALLPLGFWAFHHAVRRAKRDGSLTHF